ncbi:MAG TPA: efflux RND transporter periplasmic adaptor subunit, partial [Anaerolineales bacterium]
MHPNPRKIVPILMVVLLAALGYWYFSSGRVRADTGFLSASGTIEATQVLVSAEIGGQVSDVLVEEGQSVTAGEVLVRFADRLLQAQLDQARAALKQAQANYDLVASGLPEEQRQAAVAAAEMELLAAEQALDDLYDRAGLLAAQVQKEIAAAQDVIGAASQRRENLVSGSPEADIDAARAAVVLARDRLDRAQDDYEPYRNKAEDNLIRAGLLNKLSEAQKAYDALVSRLNNLLGETNEIDLSLAEADLAVAEAQLADAERRYARLKDGPDPDAVALAEARVANAQAHLAAARAGPSPEQLALAQAQVEAAEAALAVLEAQLEKLVLVAPLDGIVLTRTVEPGEVNLPGSPLLSLARLDALTITVYLPEDRYGTVSLGEAAHVSVDSFPGQQFAATVTHIADRAEFTPRNVQTAEGRRSTVFA